MGECGNNLALFKKVTLVLRLYYIELLIDRRVLPLGRIVGGVIVGSAEMGWAIVVKAVAFELRSNAINGGVRGRRRLAVTAVRMWLLGNGERPAPSVVCLIRVGLR